MDKTAAVTALGDPIGRRRLLLWGALGFGLASVAAAFSTSLEMLIFSAAQTASLVLLLSGEASASSRQGQRCLEPGI